MDIYNLDEFDDVNINKKLLTKLAEHPFYQSHARSLPYIGEQYKPGEGILVVAESHYISDSASKTILADIESSGMKWVEQNEVFANKWYDSASFLKLERTLIEMESTSYYNTRSVVNYWVHEFIRNKNNWSEIDGAVGKHSLENNNVLWAVQKRQSLQEVAEGKCKKNSDAYWECFKKHMLQSAFMNYYFRPSLEAANTIEVTASDEKASYPLFVDTIRVLKPSIIIFLSRNAFVSFWKYAKRKESACQIAETVNDLEDTYLFKDRAKNEYKVMSLDHTSYFRGWTGNNEGKKHTKRETGRSLYLLEQYLDGRINWENSVIWS
jgi:hypothetical protein